MNLDEYIARLKPANDLNWFAGEYGDTFRQADGGREVPWALLNAALEDGRRFADAKRGAQSSGRTLAQSMEDDGLHVTFSDYGLVPDNGHWEFAYYLEPSTVQVNSALIGSVLSHVDQQTRDLLPVDWINVFLAHEYAHFLGITAVKPPVYNVLATRLRGLKKREKAKLLNFLDEGFAMSFAREYLQMDFSPYLFNFLFLWMCSRERAISLYREVANLQ